MSTVLPVLLCGLAGVLAGGAWSLHRQGAGRGAVALTSVLAAVALVGGVFWLSSGGD